MFIVYLLSAVVSGAIIGAIARALVPGRQAMSLWQTIGLGVLGSIAGGIVGALIFRHGGSRFLGLILSVAAAVLLLRVAVKKGWVRTASA